jgi:hypothetical protein
MTIIAFVLFTILWVTSIWLIKDPQMRLRLHWTLIPLSLFGVTWLTFGNIFILRFLFLVYDPFTLGATNFPIWHLPADTLFQTFSVLALFWMVFCLSFFCLTLWFPHRAPRILLEMEQLASLTWIHLLDSITVLSIIIFIIAAKGFIPAPLVTPFGRLSMLVTISPAIAWILYFRGQPIGIRRFIYLVPLILSYTLQSNPPDHINMYTNSIHTIYEKNIIL